MRFQPTPSSRRVTQYSFFDHRVHVSISTNTLLAEGDPTSMLGYGYLRISTNTLLAEGDVKIQTATPGQCQFQPTPSSRRVTVVGVCDQRDSTISTNTLLAEGDVVAAFVVLWNKSISTNTLLAEGDSVSSTVTTQSFLFQPTPSSRRVTLSRDRRKVSMIYFNQHPPRGG